MNEEQFRQFMIIAVQISNNLAAQVQALNEIKGALDIGFSEVVQDLAEPEDEEDNEVLTFG